MFKYLRKGTDCFQNPVTGKVRNIPWNFAKFILDKDGRIISYLSPKQSLFDQIDEIEVLLGLKNTTSSGQSITKLREKQRYNSEMDNWIEGPEAAGKIEEDEASDENN